MFARFCESLRSQYKLQGLTLLGHVVRKQPTWLYKVTRHSLFKELLKLLKVTHHSSSINIIPSQIRSLVDTLI